MARPIKTKDQNRGSGDELRVTSHEHRALSGWPMILGWLAMLIFALHASTHMVGAGDTWVAMACGRHFINHGVDTVEPFSANSHRAGPTEKEIKTWPQWAQWMAAKVGMRAVKYWHPTGWINQNWLTHVLFYWLTHLSPFADAETLSFNTLVYWKFAIYIITVICVYYTGRLLGVNPALSAVFACFAMFVGRSFLDIRPAGFSNLLVAVFLLILVLATYRNILYIWLIVPLAVFWCNVHGGYIYVFIMLVPFFVLHLLAVLPRRWTVAISSILIWAALYALVYKFSSHLNHLAANLLRNDQLFLPTSPKDDWLLRLLIFLTLASLAMAAIKQIKSAAFYSYHILAMLIVFFSFLPRIFPAMPSNFNMYPEEIVKQFEQYIRNFHLSFAIIFPALIGLSIVLAFFKHKLIYIKLKSMYHIVAAGFVALVAAIVFNPFHLTNFTHTFLISASKHAEMWRTVNEWHPAFAWRNPVGTGFPFLVLFILSIGLTFFWLFSRFLKPRLLKAPRNELEAQEKLFKVLSTIFGCAAAVFICWVTFISFSFVEADVASFLLCAAFVCVLLLSIYKSVHFIYLAVGLTLLALWSGDADANYSGRYIYSFVILPAYVTLGIFTSVFSKTAKLKPKNIIFVATTAVVALSLIAIIFNPLKFGLLFSIGSEYQHHLDNGILPPHLRQQFEKKEIPLSQQVTVSVEKPGSRWSITDESKKYSVRKEEPNLSIYKYESESPVWRMGQLLQPHRIRRLWRPPYERNLDVTYKYLFNVLYIVNIGSIVIWLAIPYLQKLFGLLPNKIRQDSQTNQYELSKIDLSLMAIVALTIYMAYRSRRFIPVAAIAACPIIAMFIDQMTRTISAARNFYKRGSLSASPMPYNLQLFFIFAAAVTVAVFGTWWGLKFKRVYLDCWPTDPKLNSVFIRMTASHAKPFYACKFIRDNKLKGNMFNYWTEGGFIAWGQEPAPNTGRTPLQLFMDGRAQAAYEPKVYQTWSNIMSGGPIAQSATIRKTTPDYVKVGRWVDEQLKKHDVWVVLMPLSDPEVYNGPFVKGLEHNPNWPLVFFNNTEKLFIDVTTPQGKELSEGISNGKTLYPDEFSKDLIIAYNMLGSTEKKQGLDFAIKAFKLHPSQAPMQLILSAARYAELQPLINDFCKNYFDEFAKDKGLYAKQDGYLDRIWAALLAGKYLQESAAKQGNTELVQFYDTKTKEYNSEQEPLHKKKRW